MMWLKIGQLGNVEVEGSRGGNTKRKTVHKNKEDCLARTNCKKREKEEEKWKEIRRGKR